MNSSLTAAAAFCFVVIVLFFRRIRRDAGERRDTHYFLRVAAAFASGVLALMLAHVGGAPVGHPFVVIPSALATYAAAYNLTLFAYSFPLNRPAPWRLRGPLLIFTLFSVASTVRMSLHSGREPAWTLLYMLPHFALTALYVRRNWRRAAPTDGATRRAPSVVVQLSILTPWVLVLIVYAALYALESAHLPPWIDLMQCVVMAVLVVGGVGAAILRYHLFAVRVLVIEAVVAALVAALVASYVAMVAPAMHTVLSAAVHATFATVAVAAVPALAFAAVVDVLVDVMGQTGTRLGSPPTHRAALERALAETTSMTDPDAVLARALAAAREVTGGEVWFLRHGEVSSAQHREAPAALVGWLRATSRRFYSLDHAPELDPELVTWMSEEGVGLVAPIRRGAALHGALVVEARRLSRDASLTCAALAEHVALKFENYALYHESGRLAREVEESRRLASLGSFAAAIAHDIRTPLTSIAMNVQIVRSSSHLTESEREYLDIASEETARLNDAVQEILEFARPLQLRRQRVSPRDVVEDVARTLAPVLSERRATLDVAHRAKDVSATLVSDERALRTLLINLIENAADASPPGSTVRVETDLDDHRLRVRISDQGRGIAPENLERVFEPFFTTRADGTGLGLAIAQKVVRGHGGEISVASEVGRGTTFEVELPSLGEARASLAP
jgi:signal transduction histidine kinase